MKTGVIIFASSLGIIGGLIWLVFGSMLAFTPPGVPEVSYRNATDFNATSGIGTLLLGISMVGVYLSLKHKGRWENLGSVIILLGSILYFIGTIIRFDLNGGFEPAKPLGFFLIILGLFLFTCTVLRKKSLPKYTNLFFLICYISLLLFNDQYITAWSSAPYGLSWIFIHIILIRHQLKSPSVVTMNDTTAL